jgi:16S rRNA (cytidine1402-2'-O)-methyltransferase
MLYIIPTPIGNLEDITLRAIKTMEKVSFVLCEDGRISSKLFNLLEIKNKPTFVNIVKNNQFNYDGIKFCLQSNPDVDFALMSDAGTPAISDPGFEVVKMVQDLNIPYTVLPGATAFVPALVASNLQSKIFEFWGFLPLKKGRSSAWKTIQESQNTIILYESVHRIKKLQQEMVEKLKPDRPIFVAQEISKSHENYWRGTVSKFQDYIITEKGEFVVVIGVGE